MKISCVIPAFNRPAKLTRAILSVARQTLSPIEIVVSDDHPLGINRLACEIDCGLPIRYQRGPQTGEMADNWSCSIRSGIGDYVALLEDDNMWHRHHLETAVRALAIQIDAQLYHCGHREVVTDGIANKHVKTFVPWRMSRSAYRVFCCPTSSAVAFDGLVGGSINASTVVMRRDSVLAQYRFEAGCPMGMDTLMWCRLGRTGRAVASNYVGTTYTFDGANVGATKVKTFAAARESRYSRRILLRESLESGVLSPKQIRDFAAYASAEEVSLLILLLCDRNFDDQADLRDELIQERFDECCEVNGHFRLAKYMGLGILSYCDQISKLGEVAAKLQFPLHRVRELMGLKSAHVATRELDRNGR